MYNLHLSAEQLEIRDMIRDFVTQEVRPAAIVPARLEAPERQLPSGLLAQASQMGLRSLALPEDLGGAGADALTSCIVAEELAAGDVDLASALAQTSQLAHLLFGRAMSDAQRDKFLPGFMADDAFHLAFADREPDSDTQLGLNYHRPVLVDDEVGTTATRSGSEWIVNGKKVCVANAPLAKLFAVRVRVSGGQASDEPRIILVPHDVPGLTVRAQNDATAWHHGASGEIELKDCRVPVDNMLGPEAGRILAGSDAGFARGAPIREALNLGVGRAAYEAALDYAQMRVQGGRHLIEHQAIGAKLADIAIKLELARTMIWKAAWASDHPEAYSDRSLSDIPTQAVAQVYTAEAIYRATKDAAEIFGAMGVMKDMPLTKYVQDARIFLYSGEGTDDARLRIAESLVGYTRSFAAAARAAE
jgi:alkylation response protein AidB-like acyl-CoA dehydrogenase